tara:strand:+ start:1027 stop:1758 length:732 start_codon:yes stop_codon:yes gene_type:complete
MEVEVYKRWDEENQKHWWFEGRKKIIYSILKNNIRKNDLKILDFGCGVGVNTKMLSEFGDVTCFDPSPEAIKFLKRKFNNDKKVLVEDNLDNCSEQFDLIIAADVVEHIENDKEEIIKLHKLLKSDGLFFATVPAYQFLFSIKDIKLHHKRRYNLFNFKKLISPFFNKIKISYYNFFLFLPISLAIIYYKFLRKDFIDKVEKKPNKIINFLFYKIFSYESSLLNKVNFPFGISIIFLGKKRIE